MGRIYTAAQHIASALSRRSSAVETVMGGAAGRAAAGTALRGGQSGVRSAQKNVTSARSTLTSTLGRHDKLMSTRFGQFRSSIGGQTTMAAGAGLGAIGANLFASEFTEKFGDQLSGADKFIIGGARVGATIAGGLTAVTHLGRAGMMAKAQFSSKSVAGSKIAGHLKAAKTQAKGVQHSTTLDNLGTMSTRLEQATQWNRGAGGQFINRGIADSRNIARNMGRPRRYGRQTEHQSVGASNSSMNARLTPNPNHGAARLIERRHRQATTISNRAKTLQQQAIETRKSGISVQRSLNQNKHKINRMSNYEEATKFSARKIALGIAKAPAMLGGAMLGKGAFWGKIEPGMQFTGAAMGGGMIGGLIGGGITGITAMKMGNLGRTAGPAQRQGGRSFANINYNATLHSHRRNH